MRNLLDFLSKYRFFFYFVILEIISLVIIYNNNQYQRARMFSGTNSITGNLNRTFDNIYDYFNLKQVNESLARENARLRSSLKLAMAGIKDTTQLLPEDFGFDYISAKVLSNTVQRRNNYFMIDKGWNDGVQKDMGVMTADGIAGIVIDVSEHFASCISVLNKNSRISARILVNDHLVSVSWNGISYRIGNIGDIPNHVDIHAGDTIITSGNSHIFPKGLMIGKVEDVNDEEGYSFKTATLRFTADYNKMNFVYVIRNPFKDEIKRLNDALPDE